MRTQDLGWSFRHSIRITNLLECVFTLEYCICTLVGSNPFRVIPLLGNSSPVEGYYFQVQGVVEETAHPRGCLRRKSGCGFGFVMYTCIRIL